MGPNIFNVIREEPNRAAAINRKSMRGVFDSSYWIIKKVCPHCCNFCRAILFPVIDNSTTRS